MVELGANPVLAITGGCDGTVNVGAGTEVEMSLVALTLLMGTIEGRITGIEALVVATTGLDEVELDVDADEEADAAELEPVAEVLTGAWTWPSPIWETVAPCELMEPTGLEMPNWVEYWYCPVPEAMIWMP